MVKTRIAVLVSGGGTNLQALLDVQAAGMLPHGEIALVVSNKEGAYALTRAQQAGVAARVITGKDFEEKLQAVLQEQRIDMIVLAGFMKILSGSFTEKWPERIVNIHPALIPSFCGEGFYGLRVHEAALAYGVKLTGATVHYVNEIPDGGRIIAQKAVEIQPGDTPETLQRRVMEQAEWIILPQAVETVAERLSKSFETCQGGHRLKLMVIGGGGREHAIIQKLKENPQVEVIYALPGNAGMEGDAVCVNIGAKDIPAQVDFARANGIDFAVVAPDDPLVLGAVDALREIGVPCFGPSANAAILEGSKVFSKNLMEKYGIPTAKCAIFTEMNAALNYVNSAPLPTVVKADGLALGKGVIIAQTHEEAAEAVRNMMENKVFGESGSRVVIEEFLTGPEVSVLSFTDGKTLVPMVSSMDHKRARDNDEGLNTGGMGTVAPNPYYTEEVAQRCMEEIFLPTIRAMEAEGRPFTGCLYFGLMLTPDGPKVIEYNCRFGDPETQVVLPLLETDLLTVMQATANGTLHTLDVKFRRQHACCVVLASKGYPEHYEKGFAMALPETGANERIYVAGAARLDGRLVTNGGRVLGAVAVADDLRTAIAGAYDLADRIHFENAYCRRDIGQRALAAGKEN